MAETVLVECFTVLSPYLLVFFSQKNAPFILRLLLCHGDHTIQEYRTNKQSKSDMVNSSRYHSSSRSSLTVTNFHGQRGHSYKPFLIFHLNSPKFFHICFKTQAEKLDMWYHTNILIVIVPY